MLLKTPRSNLSLDYLSHARELIEQALRSSPEKTDQDMAIRKSLRSLLRTTHLLQHRFRSLGFRPAANPGRKPKKNSNLTAQEALVTALELMYMANRDLDSYLDGLL